MATKIIKDSFIHVSSFAIPGISPNWPKINKNRHENVTPTKYPNYSKTHFIVTYFNFSYYLLISPFRLNRNRNRNATGNTLSFSVRKNIYQNIVCGMVHVLSVYYLIFRVREKFIILAGSNASPVKNFQFIEYLSFTILDLLTLKKLWVDQSNISDIVNTIACMETQTSIPNRNIKLQHKYFSRLVCATATVIALFGALADILAPFSSWNKSMWNTGLASFGRHLLLMANATEGLKIAQPEQLTISDYCFILFGAMVKLQRYIRVYYSDLMLLTFVMTAWTAASQVAGSLSCDLELKENDGSCGNMTPVKPESPFTNARPLDWSEVYTAYKSVRKLFEKMNKVAGSLLTFYLSNLLMYNSTQLDSVLYASGVFDQLELVYVLCLSTMMLVLAADICSQIDAFTIWLRMDENRRGVRDDEINIMLTEINARQIGMRGHNIFTITYPVLWNVMATVVAYFIICQQTPQQEK